MDAVARTAKVQPSQVSITNVISNRRGSRKLLAANSLTIECTIKVSEPNAVTRITKDLTIASLNQELARGGLPQSSSVAVVSKSSTSNGYSDTYLLVIQKSSHIAFSDSFDRSDAALGEDFP